MAEFNFGIIGDPGNYRTNGTRFYYSPGGAWAGNKNINSIGPGQAAVGKLIKSLNNTDLISLGDLTYTTGASTLIDASNGLDYNNFMAPYPSPQYKSSPYQQNIGDVVWPYDLYNYPNGFPNPVTGGVGGSADGVNRFWPTIGNHDYGLRISYSEANVSLGSGNTATPVGPTSTAVPQPFIDYFGWLSNPSLLTKQTNVKIKKADGTGQSGIYYSVELGKQDNGTPLIEVFSLDAQRLMMNAGGYYNLSDGFGTNNTQTAPFNYAYDPTQSYAAGTNTAAVLSSDPRNGQDQFDWLKTSLANSKAKWKIIMGHQPIYSSGQWGKSQPDDHMSNPVLQRVLNALPEASFDAYINGHSHYYQRVLEGNNQGIGQGIPFITNGNSGRILYAINQTNYGDSVYSPSTPGLMQAIYNGVGSKGGDISPYLLPSNPTTVGVSGGYFTTSTGLYNGSKTGFTAGAYGYGFGGQDAQANDGYLFFNYKQTDVEDPAIIENLNPSTANTILTGWNGLTKGDWKPALTSGMTSAQVLSATAQFSITVGTDGKISSLSVTQAGNGYMQSKAGNHIVDFEIRGNDSYTSGNPNPYNYGIATLTFTSGKLTNATIKSPGLGYDYLAQANLGGGNTVPFSTPVTDIIPINASLLESWYTVPFIDYQDWYLITNTSAEVKARNGGNFGSVSVSIAPSTDAAKKLINTTPITTGYSGTGQQQKYASPQAGVVSIVDSLGNTVGEGNIANGVTSFSLSTRPAPGVATIRFNGDSTSSYLTNFKSSSSPVVFNYGNWLGEVSKDGLNSVKFSQNVLLRATRVDSGGGSVNFGLSSGSNSVSLLQFANSASNGVLTLDSIYNGTSWTSSEGKSFGGSANVQVGAGTWTPTATRNGVNLELKDLVVNGNNVTALFADNVTGVLTLPGTGSADATINPVVTIQRLGAFNNALAFYEADRVTGAVVSGSTTINPGTAGYLEAALANSKSKGTYLSASLLPSYQQSKVINSIPLNPTSNYGILLIADGNESKLYSSYSSANSGGTSQFQSFGATNRGITIGIEDSPNFDFDYNDLIVTIAASNVSVL
ncbi:metallophosphoesterase [Synechococcus lacustris]|uniref:metallophosphoesterase n=1 Tax=Synechococcus lacustris TaxID=2116544 RepID=UPI0020CF523B|nr:metallophosphoesterase [Synechococcus lacustris]MCP9813955.1 metallophosphoesterase [Synechococcus lacustris L1E-Slac]